MRDCASVVWSFGPSRNDDVCLFSSWPGLSHQVGYIRLDAFKKMALGIPSAFASTSVKPAAKTWMPGTRPGMTEDFTRMTLPLASRIALVTGASRGIGYATARALAKAGAHVVAVARTQAGLEAVSYTHLRAHETRHDLVCRLLLEKKKKKKNN